MSFPRFFSALLSLPLLMVSTAHATATHTADVNIELIQLDEKGKERALESNSGDFFLDWATGKCEIKLKKDQFIYCKLDTSSDIINSKGELVMKALPQAHFEGPTLDAVIRNMASGEKNLKRIIPKIVSDTSSERVKGFDLPFYSCGDCEKNGKDLVLWNAYQSYVIRDLTVKHSYLSGKPLILRMKIKGMKPVKGAFNIIGNSNASDFGR